MGSSELDGGKRRRPAARAASSARNGAPESNGADEQLVPPALGVTAPALRGGASSVTAPALRGGASTARKPRASADAAPAARRVAARAAVAHGEGGGAIAGASDSGGEVPLHDMERDLAGLLSDIDGAEGDAEARRRAAEAIGRIAARLHPDVPAPAPDDSGVLTSARHLLSTDYYLKQWGRLGMRGRSELVDDFGLDPAYEARVQPLLDLFYERYFRVRIDGAQHVPEEGAALLVCNHAGTLPWDGVMLKTALRHACSQRRALRWLTDDFVFHSPFLGSFLNRIGAVRACPENAERLLSRGELLAVFPEGVKGIGKPFRQRYQLQRFGRGGHIKLALRAGVPVIPLAIVGSEESYPLIYKLRAFAKLLGLPFIPVTPLFPWLGPLGLLPLPSRWQIIVGEPMHELEGLPPRAAEDTVLVNDLNEQLRSKVQALLQDALRARGPNAFF